MNIIKNAELRLFSFCLLLIVAHLQISFPKHPSPGVVKLTQTLDTGLTDRGV